MASEFQGCTCWWFRNPAIICTVCISLNWCRISEPSTRLTLFCSVQTEDRWGNWLFMRWKQICFSLFFSLQVKMIWWVHMVSKECWRRTRFQMWFLLKKLGVIPPPVPGWHHVLKNFKALESEVFKSSHAGLRKWQLLRLNSFYCSTKSWVHVCTQHIALII